MALGVVLLPMTMPEPTEDRENAAGDARGGWSLTRGEELSIRARLIARDERALVELIDLATPWLLGVARSMLSDPEEAEDVVLDVFRIAWEKVGTLPQGDDQRLFPWLLRITRNRAIDRLRGRRRQRLKLAHAEALGATGDPVVSPVEPDESAQPGWHVHRLVHHALAALSSEQAAAIRLAYFEGLTQSEIAVELGIPLGTVKTRLRLAFDKLRVALKPIKDWIV
jgi:RNA polymerase sigma-70 factor (ECF subfamily)